MAVAPLLVLVSCRSLAARRAVPASIAFRRARLSYSAVACALRARCRPSRCHGSRHLAIVALVSPLNSPTHRVAVCLGCLVALRSCPHYPTAHTPLSSRCAAPGALACSISVVIPSFTDAPLLPPPRSCPHAAVPSSYLGRSVLSQGRCPQHSSGSTPFLPFKITSSGFPVQFLTPVGSLAS